MSIRFTCTCGEELTVDESQRGRLAFCPACRAGVPIPVTSAPSQPSASPSEQRASEPAALPGDEYDGEICEPTHQERIAVPSGEVSWKLTCPCGKRMLAPWPPPSQTGRCPRCGRRLRLPHPQTGAGGVPPPPSVSPTAPVAPLAPAAPAVSAGSSKREEEEVGTVILEIPAGPRPAPQWGRRAAQHTAALIRADKASAAFSTGLVSAWPLAGLGPRLLSGFLDLTFMLLLTSLFFVLGSLRFLPESCLHPTVLLTAFFSAGFMNDCLLQFYGGGLGKRLVILTVRDRRGRALSFTRLLARSVLKWLLVPGWLRVFWDYRQRTLHDLLCATLVLKGREHG